MHLFGICEQVRIFSVNIVQCSPFLTSLIITCSDFFTFASVSQTHDSHKGRMILNHESPAGRFKNCGEKSTFVFATLVLNVFLLAHCVLNNIGKNRY